MRILILDDDKIRHNRFDKFFADRCGDEVVHVHNVEEATQALLVERFDLVHLDHDLEDFIYVPYKMERTGMDVAKFIVDLPENLRPHRVVVHSWNVAAAPRMVAVLRDAGIPAAWFQFPSYRAMGAGFDCPHGMEDRTGP